MSLLAVPIRRPVATGMFFLTLVLLGLIAWFRIPVELLPPVEGNEIRVTFSRPSSEPEVVEREILTPLGVRARALFGLAESWGEIRGSSGTFHARFAPGSDILVRTLELQELAAEIGRDQPPGSRVEVAAQDFQSLGRFVMVIEVTGGEDPDALLDFVEEHLSPRLAAVPGVGRILAGGGAPRELTVALSPDRAAALGVAPREVTEALERALQPPRFVGSSSERGGRLAWVVDGRPRGDVSLGEVLVRSDRPVRVRHLADLEMGTGEARMLFRVDGRPAIGLVVLQEEGANLLRLGERLERRLAELRPELERHGLRLVVGFDGSRLVRDQLDRLKTLALSGFLITLGVLYLFLRQWRAVLVVAIAVPVSLLTALALLLIAGQSLNLLTLFGLALGIGIVVDNSIVVYESVHYRLERGRSALRAARAGARASIRAVVATSLTSAVVFLPLLLFDFEDAVTRSLLATVALAVILPLVASVLVALGLVPLLASDLAAPGVRERFERLRRRRAARAGVRYPDPARALFTGLLASALRRPGGWLAGVATLALVVAAATLPWVASNTVSRQASGDDEARWAVDIPAAPSLATASELFARIEKAVLALPEVALLESLIREDGGTLFVRLAADRPVGTSLATVRRAAIEATRGATPAIEVRTDAGQGAGREDGSAAAFFGLAPTEIVLSGPRADRLDEIGRQVEARLESIPEVANAWVVGRAGRRELRVLPESRALARYGLSVDQVLPILGIVRREGLQLVTGFVLADGREVPVVVRRAGSVDGPGEGVAQLPFLAAGEVLPLGAVASLRRIPAPPTIRHHDGRRESRVAYQLSSRAPRAGPQRQALEREIWSTLRQIHLPQGYTLTRDLGGDEGAWFRRGAVPIVVLIFAVLAVTFESLTLPFLVLLALPLTLLGATGALAVAGLGVDQMALVGAVALIGLTVNPAILLVDRMQTRVRSGAWRAGAAALAAVRERARPVLMTVATSVAGLWPLALVEDRAFEIWPPFAVVVMGGLLTSGLLTLLVTPVGFVVLRRLDDLFGRLGPWVVSIWGATTATAVAALSAGGSIRSLRWQVATAILIGGLSLAGAALLFYRRRTPTPDFAAGGPLLEVRCLGKTYGAPGPIVRAWHLPRKLARRVVALGGRPFEPADARERLLPILAVLAGALYLAATLEGAFWRLAWLWIAVALGAGLAREVRRARGLTGPGGEVRRGGLEGLVVRLAPWLAFLLIVRAALAAPAFSPWSWAWLAALGALIAALQLGRRTALRLDRGALGERAERGPWRRLRTLWRRGCRRWLGFDLPLRSVEALTGVRFSLGRGMVGVLGPNGAGKTTLLRLLAGILEPSTGTITFGGVPHTRLGRDLPRWLGYLGQDFGLPGEMTVSQYLEYFALLYRIAPGARRRARVDALLAELGLADRVDSRLDELSGGMRQRVAIARTLLHSPPVIIVDEPTVGLDPQERIRFRNLLLQLSQTRLVLFSTHVVDDVAVACERVLVLARGRLLFDGSPRALAESARGRLWEVDAADAGEGAAALARRQDPSDARRVRVLADRPPHASAVGVEPGPEDGYLYLTASRRPSSGDRDGS